MPEAQTPGNARMPRNGRVGEGSKKMKKPAEIDIVRRAYELWQKAGEPEGKDQEFYHQAEKELNEAQDRETKETPKGN